MPNVPAVDTPSRIESITSGMPGPRSVAMISNPSRSLPRRTRIMTVPRSAWRARFVANSVATMARLPTVFGDSPASVARTHTGPSYAAGRRRVVDVDPDGLAFGRGDDGHGRGSAARMRQSKDANMISAPI